ncbi:UDP-glucose 4-epimerase (EC [Olavius sp. associated proteobacterium Delta 1]|nr:UDP-glucose 4-epimerase (EC [Olavius sp. associated proteobacterium Delta 1]
MDKKDLSNIIVPPNATIKKTIEAISINGVRGVFVCDEDQELIGIVMDADIRRAILSNIDLNTSVRTIMNTGPFTISSQMSSDEQKRRLLESTRILAPVVDGKSHVVDCIYLPDFFDDMFWKTQITNSRVLPPQKVLVIGGAGYIGSMLVDKLLRMGYLVRVLDLLLYGKESLAAFNGNPNFEFMRGDCREKEIVLRALDGVNAIVHLGEIVGDPACSINEPFTIDTNYSATHMIAETCMREGINRFIFASSCSVYGQSDKKLDEQSELNPISLYARCKIESENAIHSSDYNHFCPTILRLATVHGKSFRQRFDLVVNLLSIKALTSKKIQIFGGQQWRPFVSVLDVCKGIITVMHSESQKVKNQIFNLGDSRENYQLGLIGEIIKDQIPEVEMVVLEDAKDTRNYRVSFEKIKQDLGFTSEYQVADSVKDLVTAYSNENRFRDFKDNKYYNELTLKEE